MVAAHKEFPMPQDKNLYMPVLVGATKNYKPGITYQRDDDGDNISSKNPNYNELTAVYWAWKNLKDVDAIGLVQYRRYFFKGGKRDIADVATYGQFDQLLSKYDVILPRKREYFIETNYSHYVHAHHKEPLDVMRQVVAEKYPSYLDSYDKVMKKTSAHMFNMFVMKSDYFDRYARFIFGVLFEVEKRVDISDYTVQEARVFGYLSELLMDVWINENHINYTEMSVKQLGKRHYAKKLLNFLKRKFQKSGGNGTTTHF